jgi:hypothetical protein
MTTRRTALSPMAALAAILALLVQALLPAAALAARSVGVARIEVCSDQGAKTVLVGADGRVQAPQKGFAGLPCQDCAAMASAAVVAPPVSLEPVAYAVALAPHVEAAGPGIKRARAPPGRLGQGPPTGIV